MSHRHPDEQLADGLLAEEARSRGPAGGKDPLLEQMVEHELASERRVRRAAITAWSLLLALLLFFGAAMPTFRFWGAMGWRWLGAAILFGVPVLAALDLIVAILTTAAWLFRPRAASLAIIERRLAALEELLRSGR